MNSTTWVPASTDIDWADRYASKKRRLGDAAKFDALLEEGLALWRTMGQMQPEDVAEFEHRWISPGSTATFEPVSPFGATLWGSSESLMADLDSRVL